MTDINIGQATALTSPDPLMLVCTQKEDGTLNLAPVSFFMYASFNPPMLAFALGKTANSGENIRRTGKAVLAAPVALQSIDGCDIQVPEDSRIVFVVSLAQTVESGDHYLYLCNIDKMMADESKEALFAWNGYAKVAPAQEK